MNNNELINLIQECVNAINAKTEELQPEYERLKSQYDEVYDSCVLRIENACKENGVKYSVLDYKPFKVHILLSETIS